MVPPKIYRKNKDSKPIKQYEPVMAALIDAGFTTQYIHGLKYRARLKILAEQVYGLHTGALLESVEHKRIKAIGEEYRSNPTAEQLEKSLFMHAVGKYLNCPPKKLNEHELTICHLPGVKFYQTPEWRAVRYKLLQQKGNTCVVCGRGPKDRAKIHVDHIVPRSLAPERSLDITNLQVMCEDCNLGKMDRDSRDWSIS